MSMLRRLELMERRLDAIEKHLGVPPQPAAPIEPPPQIIPSDAATIPLAAYQLEASPIAPTAPQPEPVDVAPIESPADAGQVVAPSLKPDALGRLLEDHAARPVPTPRRSPLKLERAIGLKWSGWIGAVVLVIGAAMGVQFAYENHWFGLMSPALRLAMIFAVGVMLLGAGELVLRRVHQVPAASLFGAGVAVLFLGSYAGYAYFDLYTRSTSMALMGCSTLIGAAVAMRGNLVSIAVLSLIGANVAPLLVATPDAPLQPFLFYLLMMLIVALTLAAWGRGGKWWLLRGLSLCPTIFWMWGVLDSSHGQDSAVPAFMILFALLYHGELILTTIRHAPQTDDATGAVRQNAIGTTFALCVTAALALGLLRYLSAADDTTRAGCAIILSLISVALGFALPRIHRALGPLALSHRIAAAALLVLAVPLYTGGLRLEIGWMLMGLGFALSWKFTGSRIARPAAPITWMLGLTKLALSIELAAFVGNGDALGKTWLVIWTVAIGSNVILAALFALCGQLIAALILRGKNQNLWPAPARLLSGFCGFIWIAAAVCGLPHLGASAAIIAYAWLLLPCDRLVPELGLATQAGCCLLIATVKWAAVDTVAARLSPDWAKTPPVFNTMTGVGVLAAASLLGFYRLAGAAPWRWLSRRKDDSSTDPSFGNLLIAAAVIVLLTISFSFEIDHVVARALVGGWSDPLPPWQIRQLSFTILWSVSIAAIALAVGRVAIGPRATQWRHAVWLLIAVLAAKFIFLDTLSAYGDAIRPIAPIWNLQALAGMAIVACLGFSHLFAANAGEEPSKNVGWAIGLFAALMIAYTGTLEIDRAIVRHMPRIEQFGIAWHLKQLAWTVWWTLVAAATLLICRRRDKSPEPTALWLTALPVALALIVAKYLIVDLGFWRQSHAPPAGWMVLLNWDDAAAVAVLIGARLPSLLRLPSDPGMSRLHRSFRQLAAASTLLVLLIVGVIEIDRAFTLPSVLQAMKDAALAEQVALSIYLAAFAIVTLSIGFWKQAAVLRYVGLTLLGVALLKVVIVDMAQVRYGYRILSFLGLGAILLIVSVMYGKISPQLLPQSPAKPRPEAQPE